ncbi:LysM peptidoglycan-binding domain-containing protein [Clostridium saccharobutylicum]|uniref:Phage-like element pbsx protein XkdP n=1 Tax=Clostridium saccharobutylicum DSM 13864 TaxID=1345695 RepID=U5MT69_CLOSA|nr:LysM peptidoglycan-binding domain-containing protein [Clostridium saccharobutylicum]AGX43949.1 phage-like element pbsx protein XkdP [Clostridium saccharobutylicum DSM 13864]AQR91247.1 LysM domain/BON superfamily protein [Clostridium saccharobutylicum]AQS01151.1 LysM domain/BON superfamily protein [Clostridium saccharobutylicum]AQS10564.1 LysM domain/BON superfamily protein [Clostridium saccharobutylicum]AQS15134.1 LysM domain/BON superfamily protein [Clostridium saccharobutylicum]
MINIKIHYIKNDIETIQLPISPSSYKIKSSKNSASINLLGFGEISDGGTPTLKSWTISSIFPSKKYNICTCTPKSNPFDYCDLIEKLKDNNIVCTYVITKTNVNIQCTVDDIEYSEEDGSGDVYFTITFKEHKEIKLTTNSSTETYYTGVDQMATPSGYHNLATPYTVSNLAQPSGYSNLAQAYTTSYTVKDGDTLVNIAKKVYGDSSKYTNLISKNNLENVNDISVGQVLKI